MLGQATVEDYITDVVTCYSFIPSPLVLIGHSMGGIVSQKVAEKMGIHKLILFDSAPCRHVTENYLSLDPKRLNLSRRAFIMLEDGTVYIDPKPDIIKKLLFEKDNVSDEELIQTVSLLGRESAAVASQHGSC